MAKEELIAQLITRIECNNDVKVVSNPFINAFTRLNSEEKKRVAAELIEKQISIFGENGGVNNLGLLSCLWSKLVATQKRALTSPIRDVIKKDNLEIVRAFISLEEMDFIFANFDLRTLEWPWNDIQVLLKLFSKEKQEQHLEDYFKSYLHPHFSQKGWQEFLTPLTDEERYEVFNCLNLEDLKVLFKKEVFFRRVKFLFSYLSDKYKIAILQRLGSEYLYNCIYELCFDYDNLLKFLKKFNLENRKDAIKCLKSEHLCLIIGIFVNLREILELFPETDRLSLLQYLGPEFMKGTFLQGAGDDISHCLTRLYELLPSHHYIPLLKSFDSAYLQLMCDNSSNIVRVLNELQSEEEDAAFFEHVGPTALMQPIQSNLSLMIEKLREDKRLSVLRLIHQLYPELLNEIFIKRKNAWQKFKTVTKLLPKEQCACFFELFAKADLRELCFDKIDSGTKRKLEQYLEIKNTNEMKKVTEEAVLSSNNLFSIEEEPTDSEFILMPSKNSQLTSSIPSPEEIAVVNYLEGLKAEILGRIAQNNAAEHSYQNLRNSLEKLRCLLKETSTSQESTSLKALINTTTTFLNHFMKATHPKAKLKLIAQYERDIQESKTLETIGKCLAVIIIAALCLVTNAALGLALGILMGSWTAPAGIVTGFATLFADTNAGLMVANAIGFSVFAGVAGAVASGLFLFKPTPVEAALKDVIRDARRAVKEEMKSKGITEDDTRYRPILWGL